MWLTNPEERYKQSTLKRRAPNKHQNWLEVQAKRCRCEKAAVRVWKGVMIVEQVLPMYSSAHEAFLEQPFRF